MAKIKCPNPDCGFENKEGEQFCVQCGSDLTGVAQAQEPAVSAGLPSAEAAQPEVSAKPVVGGAKLVVKRTGRVGHEFPIGQESINIGRWDADSGAFPEIDLSEDDPGNHVSRRHARIFMKEDEYYIEDVGSTNGTFVNKGPRLNPASLQKLQNGDEIIIGRTLFTFVVG